jgi:hypothetical protein
LSDPLNPLVSVVDVLVGVTMSLVGEEESAGVDREVRLGEEADREKALNFASVKLHPIHNDWKKYFENELLLQI